MAFLDSRLRHEESDRGASRIFRAVRRRDEEPHAPPPERPWAPIAPSLSWGRSRGVGRSPAGGSHRVGAPDVRHYVEPAGMRARRAQLAAQSKRIRASPPAPGEREE